VRPLAIEEARSRFRLGDVAERTGIYVRRSGGSVMVRCPFPVHGHFDTSPSLRLHLDDGIWHCFGCGARGDVVEWVGQTEGVGWPEAIRLLDQGGPLKNAWPSAGDERRGATYGASRGGHCEYPEPSRTPPSRVLAALAAAWTHYTSRQLHYIGAQYLFTRGIDVRLLERHVQRFEVGHTPGTATGLVSVLRQQGFSSDELVDAGLATRLMQDGRLFDYYQQRVLVPVRDQEGRVCGIVGRNIGDERWPKYKNSPRTCTYDKSVNMYQPLPAPSSSSGQVVVVEGTLDAMAIAVAAIRSGRAEEFCPVTQSGSELSASSARERRRARKANRVRLRRRRSWPGLGRATRSGSDPIRLARLGDDAARRSRPSILARSPRRRPAPRLGHRRARKPLADADSSSDVPRHGDRRRIGTADQGSSPSAGQLSDRREAMTDIATTDDQLLVTPEEAARRLSLGRTTIYELMASGELRSVNVGRCRRVPVSELCSFVARLADGTVGQRRSATASPA
jgi:DNA primase catalytic core